MIGRRFTMLGGRLMSGPEYEAVTIVSHRKSGSEWAWHILLMSVSTSSHTVHACLLIVPQQDKIHKIRWTFRQIHHCILAHLAPH